MGKNGEILERRFTFTDANLRNFNIASGLRKESKRLAKPVKQFWAYDTGTKAQAGLLCLFSEGGSRTYFAYYLIGGKADRLRIGEVGVLPLEEAREKVREIRRKAAEGINPRYERQEQQEALKKAQRQTYEAVVDEFIEHYAKPRQRRWAQTEAMLKSKYLNDWLKRPINSISKAEGRDLLRGIIKSGKSPTARNIDAWLKTLWKWSWQNDYVDAPVMDGVKLEFEPRVRNWVYDDDALKAIWSAAEALARSEAELGEIECSYFKLLLLLAPRKNELARLRWDHLDNPDDPKVWTTPFEITKSKKRSPERQYITPLPRLARNILIGIPKRGELVFPGRKIGAPLFVGDKLKNRLIKAGAPKDFRPHGIRHTIASWFKERGYSEFEIGLVLNHSGKRSITSDYIHGYPLELKTKLLNEWAVHIESLIAPKGVAVLR